MPLIESTSEIATNMSLDELNARYEAEGVPFLDYINNKGGEFLPDNGKIKIEDVEIAIKYFNFAAQKGHAEARHNLYTTANRFNRGRVFLKILRRRQNYGV